jgi:glycosyltransferase involved in cell wall biosynthesis
VPLHVGIALATLFPGRVGGTETYVRGLLGAYGRGVGPDRVTVLANRHVVGPYRELETGPVALHHLRSYRPGDSTATRALAMITALALPSLAARDVPGDIDVMHYPVTVPIPRSRVPWIVTVHDVQHHDLPTLMSPAERRLRRRTYDDAARSADLVVTPSQASRERLVALVGVPPERIEVIPYGLDHARFHPGPDPADEGLLAPLALPERFVVYPANLWPHKNHQRLVQAFARVDHPELHLVLMGQTYGRLEQLEAEAGTLGIADRVRHLGHVPAAAVAALYRRARALVFPSLYEGFGSPPLEAMACGCPVASSTRMSLAEVCGDAALTFEPEDVDAIADAIERTAADGPERTRLREAGIERAAAFTWDATARGHAAAYERVASRPSARRRRAPGSTRSSAPTRRAR